MKIRERVIIVHYKYNATAHDDNDDDDLIKHTTIPAVLIITPPPAYNCNSIYQGNLMLRLV